MLKLWENPMLSQADRLEAAKGRIESLDFLLSEASKAARNWGKFIGPLMDELDALPNDLRSDEELEALVGVLESMAQAIQHNEEDEDDGAYKQ